MPDSGRLLTQPCAVAASAGLRIFDDQQAVFPAEQVRDFSDGEGRSQEIAEFSSAVQGSGIKHDVRVDMLFVHMGTDDESVFPFVSDIAKS